MSTLVVWSDNKPVPRLYVIPGEAAEPYKDCDGQILNKTETKEEIDTLIEHLAYMLGEEVYYGKCVPSLERFQQEVQQPAIMTDGPSAFAPWGKYVVASPVQLNDVRLIVRTGWV